MELLSLDILLKSWIEIEANSLRFVKFSVLKDCNIDVELIIILILRGERERVSERVERKQVK